MDENLKQLVNVLVHTYHHENNLRMQAEATLKNLEQAPGFQGALLQIVTKKEVDIQVRQAAAIRLKNIVTRNWSREDGDRVISPADRKIIRDNIVEALIWQDAKMIRVQLQDCVFAMARADYPGKWNILPVLLRNLEADQPYRIYGAVTCLRMIYKVFEFRSQDRRKPIEALVRDTFPKLLQLLARFYGDGKNATADSCMIAHQLFKIFYLATVLAIPKYLLVMPTLAPWMQLIASCIALDPAENPDIKTLGHPIWKCKKWASRAAVRLFNRFGREGFVDEGMKGFARAFFDNFSAPLLQVFMKNIHMQKIDRPCSSVVMQCSYRYLSTALNHAKLYKLMKPHLHMILFDGILKTLILKQEDLRMWKDDPYEFVRRALDIMEEFTDPRTAAQQLLIDLVKTRTKDTLSLVLNSITQILNDYSRSQNHTLKEAALRMFGTLNKLVRNKENLTAGVEAILVNHVIPELASPFGHLCSRACMTFGQFHSWQYKNPNVFAHGVQQVAKLMTHDELPVVMQAALTLSTLVKNPAVKEFVYPTCGPLLERYFALFDEIGNDEIIRSMTIFIDEMGEMIAPMAKQMSTQIIQRFLKLVQAPESDDEAHLSAASCIRALGSIIYACHNHSDTFNALEELCAPLINKMFCADGIEYFEEIMELMTYFTLYRQPISGFMWSMLPKIFEAYFTYATDYLQNMLPILDNYISHGGQFLLQGDNLKVIYAISEKILTDPLRWRDAQFANKLLVDLVSHYRGVIDPVMNGVIDLAVKKILNPSGRPQNQPREEEDEYPDDEDTMALLLSSLDLLAACSYYNPYLLIQTLLKRGDLERVFGLWTQCLPMMHGHYAQQKYAIIGLSTINLVPVQQLPKLIQEGLPSILVSLVDMFEQMMEDDDENKLDYEYDPENDEKADDDDSDDDDYEAVENFDDVPEDEDAIDDDEMAWMQQLSSEMAGGFYDPGEDIFVTPLDSMKESVYFSECLQELAGRDAQFYQSWVGSLNDKQKKGLQAVLQRASMIKEQEKKEKEDQK